jgi:hypothetical protein
MGSDGFRTAAIGTHDPLVLNASGQARLDQTGLFPPNGVVPVTAPLALEEETIS